MHNPNPNPTPHRTGAIHETGHALYEQNRNGSPEWLDQPVSAALSMGVHESQSLLWERMVALSAPFQTYLLPKILQVCMCMCSMCMCES